MFLIVLKSFTSAQLPIFFYNLKGNCYLAILWYLLLVTRGSVNNGNNF